MSIDLHIHSKASDGKLDVREIIMEAKKRRISFIAITDHDNISCQIEAKTETKKTAINYITGVELNITLTNPKYKEGKPFALDLLGYQFNPDNEALKNKLALLAKYREKRVAKIIEKVNLELKKQGIPEFSDKDLQNIKKTVEGSLGRPHIADYMVKKGIVTSRHEAFDKYLVECDVPKYPLNLKEASKLIREAGGKLVLAHPNDPNGTSLYPLTSNLIEQTEIIKETILTYIDGIECWHTIHNASTEKHYVAFAKENGLIMTGGSDCHQKPVIMGTIDVPHWVALQFRD